MNKETKLPQNLSIDNQIEGLTIFQIKLFSDIIISIYAPTKGATI